MKEIISTPEACNSQIKSRLYEKIIFWAFNFTIECREVDNKSTQVNILLSIRAEKEGLDMIHAHRYTFKIHESNHPR